MRHLFRVENIDRRGSNWPLGAKMCFFYPKIWIFGAKGQFTGTGTGTVLVLVAYDKRNAKSGAVIFKLLLYCREQDDYHCSRTLTYCL